MEGIHGVDVSWLHHSIKGEFDVRLSVPRRKEQVPLRRTCTRAANPGHSSHDDNDFLLHCFKYADQHFLHR